MDSNKKSFILRTKGKLKITRDDLMVDNDIMHTMTNKIKNSVE